MTRGLLRSQLPDLLGRLQFRQRSLLAGEARNGEEKQKARQQRHGAPGRAWNPQPRRVDGWFHDRAFGKLNLIITKPDYAHSSGIRQDLSESPPDEKNNFIARKGQSQGLD